MGEFPLVVFVGGTASILGLCQLSIENGLREADSLQLDYDATIWDEVSIGTGLFGIGGRCGFLVVPIWGDASIDPLLG